MFCGSAEESLPAAACQLWTGCRSQLLCGFYRWTTSAHIYISFTNDTMREQWRPVCLLRGHAPGPRGAPRDPRAATSLCKCGAQSGGREPVIYYWASGSNVPLSFPPCRFLCCSLSLFANVRFSAGRRACDANWWTHQRESVRPFFPVSRRPLRPLSWMMSSSILTSCSGLMRSWWRWMDHNKLFSLLIFYSQPFSLVSHIYTKLNQLLH